jgi:hypothetical protein
MQWEFLFAYGLGQTNIAEHSHTATVTVVLSCKPAISDPPRNGDLVADCLLFVRFCVACSQQFQVQLSNSSPSSLLTSVCSKHWL